MVKSLGQAGPKGSVFESVELCQVHPPPRPPPLPPTHLLPVILVWAGYVFSSPGETKTSKQSNKESKQETEEGKAKHKQDIASYM